MNTVLPLYQSIALKLIDKIENGVYQKGDLLPTEARLCKEYLVSRVTIRQALQLLADKSYTKKIQGSGSHVIYSKHHALLNRSSKIRSFSEEMRLMGRIPTANVTVFEMIRASISLAGELGLEPDEPVYFYERLLLGDQFPYCLEHGYLPVRYFPDLSIQHLSHSKMAYMEQTKGYTLSYSNQIIHAVLSDDLQSQLLQVGRGTPLLEVTHITWTSDGIPLEKVQIVFDSQVYEAHYIKTRSSD